MTTTMIEPAAEWSPQVVAGQAAEQWSAACQHLLDQQRGEVLSVTPPAETLRAHRVTLKLLLRFGHALYLTACDPDYPDRQFAERLRGRLAQLEHSWRLVHEPLADAEADPLIGTVFPQ